MRIALPVGLLRRELRRIAPGVEGARGRASIKPEISDTVSRQADFRHQPEISGTLVSAGEFRRNILFGDSAGDEASNGLQPVPATRRTSSRKALICKGNMDPRFSYLDASSSYVGMAGQTASTSSSYLSYSYAQKPAEDFPAVHAQWGNSNYYASATLDYRPVNNIMSSSAVARSYNAFNSSDIPYGQVSTKCGLP